MSFKTGDETVHPSTAMLTAKYAGSVVIQLENYHSVNISAKKSVKKLTLVLNKHTRTRLCQQSARRANTRA